MRNLFHIGPSKIRALAPSRQVSGAAVCHQVYCKEGIASTPNPGSYGQRGISKLTLIVFSALLGALLYSSAQILPFFYYFAEFQHHLEEAVKVAGEKNDLELRRQLLYQIHWMKLPVDDSALIIQREGDYIRISLKYEEVFYVPWRGKDYDIYIFPFHAKAEGRTH